MSRGVQCSLVFFIVFLALLALAGCSHYFLAEREPWRHDAEVACMNSGAVKETTQRVRISSISGPGICGLDLPIRVAALGDAAALAYDADPPRPPGNIPGTLPPDASRALPPVMSQGWPDAMSRKTRPTAAPATTQPAAIQSRALPSVQSSGPQYNPYAGSFLPVPPRTAPVPGQAARPLSPTPPHPRTARHAPSPPAPNEETTPPARAPPPPLQQGRRRRRPPPPAPPTPPPAAPPPPPRAPPRGRGGPGGGGPAEATPPATLAC